MDLRKTKRSDPFKRLPRLVRSLYIMFSNKLLQFLNLSNGILFVCAANTEQF